jgi:hypothetical protein
MLAVTYRLDGLAYLVLGVVTAVLFGVSAILSQFGSPSAKATMRMAVNVTGPVTIVVLILGLRRVFRGDDRQIEAMEAESRPTRNQTDPLPAAVSGCGASPAW